MAVLVTGAGYAYWTDSITVNNTIETGKLEVTLLGAQEKYNVDQWGNQSWNKNPELKDNVDMLANSQGETYDLHMGKWKDLSGLTTRFDTTNNTISFNFQNMYPGCTGYTEFSAKNTGTVPAAIQTVSFGGTLDNSEIASELGSAMKVDYSFTISNADTGVVRKTITESDVALSALESTLKADLEGLYLLPGEELTSGATDEEGMGYTMNFKIPGTSLTGDQGEEQTIAFDLDFDFVQHNAATVAVSDNN